MFHRLRILPSLFAIVMLAGVISQAASCTLDQSGTTPPPDNEACIDDTTCDDEDQCTADSCGPTKICVHLPVDGPAAVQTAGDCQQGFCANGKFTQNPDDEDRPDDLESCTMDSCDKGVPKHEELSDGMSCTSGVAAGLCKAGICTVECDSVNLCNDGNPCTVDTCNASTGTCTFAALDGLPTPFYTQKLGDCSQQICVNGVSTAIADETDKPEDNNFCTHDYCENGVPKNDPANANSACLPDGSGICDAMGKCLECMTVNQCPAFMPDNGCRIRTCIDNKCGEMLVGMGVDVDPTKGDCKGRYCDGMGTAMTQNNDADVPIDNNPCTKDMCTNGMPSNPPESSTTPCGASMCDGMGKCGCSTDAECGANDLCKSYTCVNMKCQIAYTAQGMPVGMQVDGDCRLSTCDGAGNPVSAIDQGDFLNDMNDCTMDFCSAGGVPSNPFLPLNDPCNQNGGTVCNGFGACLKAVSANCMNAAECASGYCTDGVCCVDTCPGECMACNVTGTTGTCTNVPSANEDAPFCTGTNSCDGMGACKRDNGQACGANADCTSGFCVDGVCCNSACNDTCKSCNLTGTMGVCTLVPNDTTDPTGTAPCNNPYRCNGTGSCKATNGVACMVPSECLSNYCADGFCCGNICDQLCRSCSNTLTGAGNGNCRPILNGTDPANECPNGECNGNGACTGLPGLGIQGSPCTAAGQCLSGFCVDGVCCNEGCTQSCRTCNRQGSVGACSNVPYDTFDMTGNPPCTNGFTCDGNGVCKGLNGAACTSSTQCLSNFCVDGFCCNNICNQLCRSCAATLNGGANGVCGNTKNGADPHNECMGDCNGSGMCTP